MFENQSMIMQGSLNNDVKYYLGHEYSMHNTIQVLLVVKVGSRCDPYGQEGIAHYLEHMLLAFDRTEEEKKLLINHVWGCTNFDETVFHVTVINEIKAIKAALNLIAKMIQASELNADNMESVRQDILNEWEVQVNPGEGSFKARNILFPYMKKNFNVKQDFPVGDLEAIKKIEFEHIKAFHKQYYDLRNMSILLIGKTDHIPIHKLLEKTLGIIKNPAKESYLSLRRNFGIADKSKRIVVFNQDKRYEVIIGFLRSYTNQVMNKTFEDTIVEKICLRVLARSIVGRLEEQGYELDEVSTDRMWLMVKDDFQTIHLRFKQLNRVEEALGEVEDAIRSYETPYLTEDVKKEIYEDIKGLFLENKVETIVEACVADWVYGEVLNVMCFEKAIRNITERLTQAKINRYFEQFTKKTILYRYIDIDKEHSTNTRK